MSAAPAGPEVAAGRPRARRTAGWLAAARLAAVALAAACGGGAGGTSAPPMTASGMPMEHLDMEGAMADAGRGMSGDMCAVGPGPDRALVAAEPHVALVVDAAGASRPTRVLVGATGVGRPGVAAELSADGGVRVACAGDDLMITGPALSAPAPRLALAARLPVRVVARTADGRVLAGPVRVAPGATDVALAWGGGGR